MSRNILIIGASSAIGCDLIRKLAGNGDKILAHFNSNRVELDQLNEIYGDEVVPMRADLSKAEEVEALLTDIDSKYGTVHKIVFLAAPHFALKRFKELSVEDFNQLIQVQLLSSIQILRHLIPGMVSARYGKIVFMLTSYTMGVPPSNMAHYVTSKYSLLGLMMALSAEYSGKNLCINAISPSMVQTDYLKEIPEKVIEFTAHQHPRKKIAVPAEISPAISFLLSDEAGYITGVNLPVTAGA